MISINVAILLAVIIYFRVRRPVEPRKRSDQWVTVALVLSLGLVIYPTDTGKWLTELLGSVLSGVGGIVSSLSF